MVKWAAGMEENTQVGIHFQDWVQNSFPVSPISTVKLGSIGFLAIMEILLSSSIFNVSPLPSKAFVAKHIRHRGRARPVFCLGLDSYDDLDVREDLVRSATNEPQKKHSRIWQLFGKAQQNILHIHKQRLMALDELERVKKENVLLLERIEELEAKELLGSRKGDVDLKFLINKCWVLIPIQKSPPSQSTSLCILVQALSVLPNIPSISSELLLRIDSMVLAGTIGNNEAFDLRRLVMESRMSVADSFSEIKHKKDAELLAELRHYFDRSRKQGVHIIHICTEMAPVASVGPLASYVTGLSSALQKKGHLVEVILPKVVHGIAVTFIQPIYYSSFFSHERRIYGFPNDFERFMYFSRASLDYILKIGKQPDVLHIHNWQTAIIGPLFWDIFVNQCLEEPEKLALCGLDPSKLHRPDRLQDNYKLHLVNILKSYMISLVSPGNVSIFPDRDKILISPHGFEKSIWDPSVDQLLPQSYNVEDMQGKSVCKSSLQQQLGLTEDSSRILVGCVYSDLSDFDTENLKTLVWMASRKGVQFVFMAYSSDSVISGEFEYFQEELTVFGLFPSTQFLEPLAHCYQIQLYGENVRFVNKYDEALLHLIFAGSDIMLCPSFDDPVLQLPVKAMRYGTAPVAVNFSDNTKFRQDAEHDFECAKVSEHINNSFAKMSLSQAIDEIEVLVLDPDLSKDYLDRIQNRTKDRRYTFDYAFGPSSTNLDVYKRSIHSTIAGVVQGLNATIFAYGSTGSGKTYTMVGSQDDPGLMVLSLKTIFELIKSDNSSDAFEVTCSYLEVYNEVIYDLLEKSSGHLELREDPEQGIIVAGLRCIKVNSADKILELLNLGNSRRKTESTEVNGTSSRSHAVLGINVTRRQSNKHPNQVIRGKLALVDLAGSERASETQSGGQKLRDGANINRSLLALANCINALGKQQKKGLAYVPYRNSKLTRILKDGLSGNSQTIMIATISPAGAQYHHTVNTLKYASRAKEIKTHIQNIEFIGRLYKLGSFWYQWYWAAGHDHIVNVFIFRSPLWLYIRNHAYYAVSRCLPKNIGTIDTHVSDYQRMIDNLQNEVGRLRKELAEKESQLSAKPTEKAVDDEMSWLNVLSQETSENVQERINLQKALFELEETNLHNRTELQQLDDAIANQQAIEKDGAVVQVLRARRQVILDNIRDNDELGVQYQMEIEANEKRKCQLQDMIEEAISNNGNKTYLLILSQYRLLGIANTELQFEMAMRDQIIHNQRETQRNLWNLLLSLGFDEKQIFELALKQGITIEDSVTIPVLANRRQSNLGCGRYPQSSCSAYSGFPFEPSAVFPQEQELIPRTFSEENRKLPHTFSREGCPLDLHNPQQNIRTPVSPCNDGGQQQDLWTNSFKQQRQSGSHNGVSNEDSQRGIAVRPSGTNHSFLRDSTKQQASAMPNLVSPRANSF
ncbi:hypothetical protein M9H77_05633 [Catharanthus roseus]|uniref:Uncharacterized protein n=1 Tax=Catharanthus roseus TaxID=4058 RepID=A0ACC0CHN5_CATRO|nr:hypothetical protein M9H77_05633 [Catharanthus roseus]